MSTRKGNNKKGPPKHQNAFAFKHNKGSVKTKKLLAKEGTTAGLCARCVEIIEWKLKYRKYKSLKDPKKCNGCLEKKVRAAYHTLCQTCAKDRGVCAKCVEKKPVVDNGPSEVAKNVEATIAAAMAGPIPGMKERERRALLREVERRGREGVIAVAEGEEDEDEEEEEGKAEAAAAGSGSAGGVEEEKMEDVEVGDAASDDDADAVEPAAAPPS